MKLVQCAECGREYNTEKLANCPRCRANESVSMLGSSAVSEREAVFNARRSQESDTAQREFPSHPIPHNQGVDRWEYLIQDLTITDKWNSQKRTEEFNKFSRILNQLGAQGWELISYEAIPLVGNWSKDIKGYAYLAILKRRIAS